MKIYSWNVNGIRAVLKKGTFQPFIDKHQPDILCLQETKATKEQLEKEVAKELGLNKVDGESSRTSMMEGLGYIEYWNSAEKAGYSGTAIFAKQEPLTVINGLPEHIIKKFAVSGDLYGDPGKEGRVIAAEFDQFYVVTVYTPNAKDDLSRIPLRHKHWDPAFLAYCKELEQKKPVVFNGDLNVAHTPDDLARPKQNEGKKGYTNEEREGFQNFLDAGFIDTLRLFKQGPGHYTWWTHWANARARNVGWRIDYIMASKSLRDKIKNAEIHSDVMGSDHCPISLDLDI